MHPRFKRSTAVATLRYLTCCSWNPCLSLPEPTTRRLQDIPEALAPLVEFAKEILKDYEEDWKRFPIYLKATAGMRQLSYNDRETVLAAIRDYLGNPETCPFYFQFDQARVISGEEVRAPSLELSLAIVASMVTGSAFRAGLGYNSIDRSADCVPVGCGRGGVGALT